MSIRYLFLLVTLILSACATGPYPISSPYFRIPVDSQLLIQQPLTIPANKGRVYIQNGKVVSEKEKDQYYPHCWLLSRKVLPVTQTIKPDSFKVVESKKFEDDVRIEQSRRLASLHLSGGLYAESGATAIENITELTIYSAKQPDIFRFACSRWNDPADAEHLTVATIQKTLGVLVKIELAQ